MVKILKNINLTDSMKKQLRKNDKVSFIIDSKKAPITGTITDIIGTLLCIKVASTYYSADASEVTKL